MTSKKEALTTRDAKIDLSDKEILSRVPVFAEGTPESHRDTFHGIGRQLQRSQAAIVTMFGGFGYRVRFCDPEIPPSVDLKKKLVNFPVWPDNPTRQMTCLKRGYTDHETAHILYTDPKVKRDYDRTTADMHNVIEDGWVEREYRKVYPGVRMNLDYLNEHFFEDTWNEIRKKGTVDSAAPFILAMFAARGVDTLKFMKEKGIRHTPLVDVILKYDRELHQCKSTEESKRLALLIVKELKELMPEKPEMPGMPGKGEPKEGEGKSEGKGSSGKSGKSGGDSPDTTADDDDQEGGGSGSDEDDDAFDDVDDEDLIKGDFEDGSEDESSEDEGEDEFPDGDGPDDADDEDTDDGESEDPAGEDSGGREEDKGDEGDGTDKGTGDGASGPDSSSEDEGESDTTGEASGGEPDTGGESGSGGSSRDHEFSPHEHPESDGSGGGSPGRSIGGIYVDGEDGDLSPESEDDLDPEIEEALRKALEESGELGLQTFGEWTGELISELIQGYSEVGALYTPYRDRDQIITPEYSVSSSSLTRVVQEYQRARGKVGVIANKILIHMKTRAPRYKRFQKEGIVDDKRLAQFMLGDDKVFRRKRKVDDIDTVFSLLIDMSGSMDGRKLELAAQVAMIFSEVLEAIEVRHEILAFSTVSWDTPRVPGCDRTIPLQHVIIKQLHERLGTIRGRFSYVLDSHNTKHNVDGEAVEWAAMRLAQAKEKRKILMVLSDGWPECGQNSALQYANLKRVIEEIEDSGFYCIGIGITSPAVKAFYNDHVVFNSLDELLGGFTMKLEEVLMRSKAIMGMK